MLCLPYFGGQNKAQAWLRCKGMGNELHPSVAGVAKHWGPAVIHYSPLTILKPRGPGGADSPTWSGPGLVPGLSEQLFPSTSDGMRDGHPIQVRPKWQSDSLWGLF